MHETPRPAHHGVERCEGAVELVAHRIGELAEATIYKHQSHGQQRREQQAVAAVGALAEKRGFDDGSPFYRAALLML